MRGEDQFEGAYNITSSSKFVFHCLASAQLLLWGWGLAEYYQQPSSEVNQ